MPSLLDAYLDNTPPGERSRAAIASLAGLDVIAETSPEVARAIIDELIAQRTHVKLIASENFCSMAVMLSMGNWLTDKYAEGVVGKRFYAGCEQVDQLEGRAVSLAKQLFQCEHAYVQPHSGADANMVAYWSVLIQRIQQPEIERLGKKSVDALTPEEYESVRMKMMQQTMMGMALDSGGHLTHGYRHSFSSKMMRSVSYGVDPTTGWLDYDRLREQVLREKPLLLIAGYSSYPRRLNFAKMREIADMVGATLLVDMAHFAGLVAGGVFHGEENPIPYADIITSTTHKTLRGPRGGLILCKSSWKETIDRGCPLVLGGPLPQVMAAKAVAFEEALRPSFKDYAAKILENARALAESLRSHGVELVTGGTDNHLVMMQVANSFGLTGRQAEMAMRECGLTVNRNSIPADPMGPLHGSGIRMGTPAVTTLGMGTAEMGELAELIVTVLRAAEKKPKPDEAPQKAAVRVPQAVCEAVRARVLDLMHRFPLYPEIPLSEATSLCS